jgi:hypothetical protein
MTYVGKAGELVLPGTSFSVLGLVIHAWFVVASHMVTYI